MIMGSPREDSLEHIKPTINNKIIPRVKSTKILGIHFDHLLKFDKHLEELSKDLNKKVGVSSTESDITGKYTSIHLQLSSEAQN